MIPDWAADYVGIPYKNRGASVDGVDCYGLVRLIFQREYGVALPDLRYASADSFLEAEGAVMQARPDWHKVQYPVPGSILLLRFWGEPVHVAVVLDHEFMLHCLRGHHSAIERFNGPKWQHRIEGAYTYGN